MKKSKKYDYFEALEGLSKCSYQSAKHLQKVLSNYEGEITELQIREAHEIEHTGDLKKHDMMNYLMKEFITPIDREDIVTISQGIDDVTDAIEDVLIKMYMFHIKELPEATLKFAELILSCSDAMRSVMKEFCRFKKPAKLHGLIIEVNSIENEGDALYTDVIRSLYSASTDPVELLVWTEIYRSMENCLDSLEDVIVYMELVVMKNS